jgi:hypothetical protein
MIITRILETSGTNARIEVRDHGFPKEADMASLQSNHRPRTVPPAAAPGTDPGTATSGEDSTFLRRSVWMVSASPRSC